MQLRRLDSIADTVLLPLIEVTRYAYDFRKFGKEAGYHMWSAKLWGLLRFVGMASVLVPRRGAGDLARATISEGRSLTPDPSLAAFTF